MNDRAAKSWADDDEWKDEEKQHQQLHEMAAVEKMERVEVKIRVTRRQLQELLEKAAGDSKGRPVEKVLAEMISSGKVCYEQEATGHWRPSLQSIPEADELLKLMGNCGASRHAVASWADGDEWEEEEAYSSSSEDDHRERREHVEEVTIRITKRQLHELMEAKAAGGKSRRSTQQLLADIMNSGEVHHHHDHHRQAHWKPALQSIPEAVES
uniref:Uncharacterized protein n=1 Tax=Leersia perrieri TaxID=77586 RepID=A0A0D9V6N6_9ORYZ